MADNETPFDELENSPADDDAASTENGAVGTESEEGGYLSEEERARSMIVDIPTAH